MMDNNFFALFGLPVGFDIDKTSLKSALLSLQKQHHPDRTEGEALAVNQQAALINHAYNTLANTDSRAAYLLQLEGQALDLDKSIDDWAFLGDMMEMRISLDELSDSTELQKLVQTVQSVSDRTADKFKAAFSASDYVAAQDGVRKLKFLAKLLNDIHAKISQSIINTQANNDDDLYV